MRFGPGRGGLPVSTTVRRRRSWLWLQGLACGAALSVATGPVLMMGVLLAPALMAYAIERNPAKPAATTMLLFSAATTFTPLRDLWQGGQSIEGGLLMLGDPMRAGLAWVAAGTGWLLEEMAQAIAGQYSDIKTRHRIAALNKERAALVEEWGSFEPPPRLPRGR
jgi:hypothetical protein